ncbi:unnamed protein product [Rotaria sordida]|uniref:Uncharacterized protein n=1 Tax=Rotaria sordida TaxID=392033 RepID=A0A814A4U9_9BILA|nr:unnamed protein product [Rotaria sordida]CAF1212350.1 unnamed protein product [Rotaria sordida]
MSSNSFREALHAGITHNINDQSNIRAIIALHAGYNHSGSTAAYAYKYINRIFPFGPSHHFSLNTCVLTNHIYYETPLYNIKIDTQISIELYRTQIFFQL